MKFLLTSLITLLSLTLCAQQERILYNSFSLEDITEIVIDLDDYYTIKAWPGDQLMIETNVAVYGSTKSLFDAIIERNRYGVSLKSAPPKATLSQFEKNRRLIKLKSGNTLEEQVSHLIYLPEDFEEISDGHFKRKSE